MDNKLSQNNEEKIFLKISETLLEKKGLQTIIPQGSKGGFGLVLFVQDIKTKIKYAVKAQSIIDETNGGIDDVKFDMCKQESDVLKSIKHKNIVEYHSDFTIGFYHFIQMNLCECSLDDWIEKRNNQALPNGMFLHFLNQILDGIEHLHFLNYVLRDLSAKNILISSDGTVKLCDFGLVKKIESQDMTSKIQSNNIKGVFIYYPPELIRDLELGSKSGDIWALGICLSLLGGLNFMEVSHFNQAGANIKLAPLLDNFCNSIIQFILKKNPRERPSISSIRKFIFDKLSQNGQELQFNQPNIILQTKGEIDNFYNSRELDIDISKYKETERECLKNQNDIVSLIKLGYINMHLYNNLDNAYKYFINAQQLNKNDPDIYLGLSQIIIVKMQNYAQENRETCFELIEYYIEQARQISSNYWRVHYQNFIKNYILEDDKIAKEFLEKAMKIKKNHSMLISFQYVVQSYENSDPSKNKKILNQFESENFSIKYIRYYLNLAQVAFNASEYIKSNEYYLKELKYFPQNCSIYNNIGYNNVLLKQYSEAKKNYEKAIDINPNFEAAKINLTNLILKMKKEKL